MKKCLIWYIKWKFVHRRASEFFFGIKYSWNVLQLSKVSDIYRCFLSRSQKKLSKTWENLSYTNPKCFFATVCALCNKSFFQYITYVVFISIKPDWKVWQRRPPDMYLCMDKRSWPSKLNRIALAPSHIIYNYIFLLNKPFFFYGYLLFY